MSSRFTAPSTDREVVKDEVPAPTRSEARGRNVQPKCCMLEANMTDIEEADGAPGVVSSLTFLTPSRGVS